jgi:serine/threonine-protein kinase HipA
LRLGVFRPRWHVNSQRRCAALSLRGREFFEEIIRDNLERIGGECAGAVNFITAGQLQPERNYSYRKLSERELAAILRELPRRPLLAGEEGIRLSLAGAQDKIAVRLEHGEVYLPLGGAPSTHIL